MQDAHTHSSNAGQGGGGAGRDAPSGGGDGYKANYYTPGLSINNTTATNIAILDTNAISAHNTIQPSIVKVSAIKYRPSTNSSSMLSAATSIQGYFESVPANYLLEDGSAVSRAAYSDLFAAIGTTYGVGDGSTTFNLPDSRGRTAVNKSSTDTEFDVLGEKYGEKSHTDTVVESGEQGHNHTQNAHTRFYLQ